jgi:hypothetical protein
MEEDSDKEGKKLMEKKKMYQHKLKKEKELINNSENRIIFHETNGILEVLEYDHELKEKEKDQTKWKYMTKLKIWWRKLTKMIKMIMM